MHTRICTQVCKFLEMISKDGMFCLLRLTSLSGGLAGQSLSLCFPSSPSAHLPPPPLPLSIPSVLPSSLLTALLFSPDWPALSFHHCALWASVSLRQESVNFSFFQRSR